MGTQMRAALGIVVVLLLFTICKSWIFDSDAWLKKVAAHSSRYQVDFGNSESSEPDEDFRRFPYSNVRSERCDACRIIARRFDSALGAADSAIQGPRYEDFAEGKKEDVLEMRELDPAAVSDIIDRVCARETFADVTPVWDNQPDTEMVGDDSDNDAERLTADGAEMWEDWRRGGIRLRKSDANWAQRMANHCRYFATEKLQGAEIYDMWLRISAGIGGDPFEYFLCHGEGVFADCLSDKDGSRWPAGDAAPEDEDYDEFARNDDENAAVWTEPDLHVV